MGNKGFTIIELSMVLVIVGLLISGVMVGKGLVEHAKFRSQIIQLEEYKTAFYAFQLKYSAIAGDMGDASDYFSGVNDGNNDGRLDGDANWSQAIPNEGINFFQHLSNAGFIKGTYDGTWAIGEGYPRIKFNDSYGMVAAGALRGPPYGTYQLSADVGGVQVIAALYLNVSRSLEAGSNYNDAIGVFTVLDAYTLDQKIDDGIATKGIFQSSRPYGSTQGSCLTGLDGDYLLSQPGNQACHTHYIIAD